MRYYLFLPMLLVGSLTGCAVYGGGYGHSGYDYDRSYRSGYEVRKYPVYALPPRHQSRYYDSRHNDYRQPPRRYAPPPPPHNAYRPPVQRGWETPRHQNPAWGNRYDQRNMHRPPPPPQRHDNRRGEIRGWESRR
ncbi:hypothetical protein [Pseudomonas sp. TTU2014-080ASC]|uniref:hypothetical protein n=1 Tax=Pseudomonas sp. TTU2014-080ASC TaxID=1729724 RepID=UPI00071843CD|nr:hypothetical protein [Pseudomonas sp. TTU2014-080ASC]KRW59415.1 hypothetical protein AO726_11395 [Pseudomonas sp. TTU2014-080ASC]